MSLIFDAAIEEWRRVRADYQLHLESQYDAAVTECNGVLLNARGKAAAVSTFSLFMGPGARAAAYASEELMEFWQRHPRLTFQAYEKACYRAAIEDVEPWEEPSGVAPAHGL